MFLFWQWDQGQRVAWCICLRRYQIILHGNRGTCVWMTCPRLHSTVQRLGLNQRSSTASQTL